MTNRWARARSARRRAADGFEDDRFMLGLGTIAKKVFGTPNDRRIKAIRPLVERDQRARARVPGADDAGLRAKTAEFRERLAKGETPRRPAARGLRQRPRGGPPRARPAALRRAADGRHLPAPGQHRRDEDRRGQDAGRDAAGLPQRADRPRRARRHRQRLPRPARRRVDGPGLPRARADRRRRRARHARGRRRRSPTTPTSPTPPTTSSASTTCATT